MQFIINQLKSLGIGLAIFAGVNTLMGAAWGYGWLLKHCTNLTVIVTFIAFVIVSCWAIGDALRTKR